MTDSELLQQYVDDSQEAFALLVNRHLNWVYSVAKRRVGEANLAEDVSQAVFILLARRAAILKPQTIIPVWLLKATVYVSQTALRSERRRRIHERASAMERGQNQMPRGSESDWIVDRCVGSLRRRDREALLLRFYRQLSLREVGESLGISEEAARKRVTRALGRLKEKLEARGFSSASALSALTMTTGGRWIETAPIHLTTSAAQVALRGFSGTERAVKLAQGVNRMLAWTKAKLVIAAMIIVLLPAIVLVSWVGNRVRGEDESVPAAAPAATSKTQENFVMSQKVVVALSPDSKRAWVFSVGGGQWTRVLSPPGATSPIIPVVADSVGALQSGRYVYGFSGINGKSDYFEVPAGFTATPIVATDVVECQVNSRVYAFSAITGKWDAFDLPAGVVATPTVMTDMVYVFEGTHFWAFGAQRGKWEGIDTSGN